MDLEEFLIIDHIEGEKKSNKNKNKKVYTFDISYTMSNQISIEANSEEEARALIDEMLINDEINFECDNETKIELL